MTISFHGAAQTVTGSKHLLTLEDNTKILLDCGMFQGLGAKTQQLNSTFGFEPSEISALILSHAHIDHSGLIPKLVKEGFAGKIYCTTPTRELTEILLLDSASIQLHDAELQNRQNSGNEVAEPLYDLEDVHQCFTMFEEVAYNEPFDIGENVTVVFTNTGHLIGSAAIHLTIKEKEKTQTILFSGDVGRYRSTLLQCPETFLPAEHIILETTYGDSTHGLPGTSVDTLLEWIEKACIKKKGKLIIPAFSVGRTQEVLFGLNQLELEKRLPAISYFVDSPLSKRATQVMKDHMDQFNDKLQGILKTDADPFDFAGLKYIETPEDSKALTLYEEPCVIISASGTADAGRVKHHIFSTINDQKHTILFVGYCQEQSTGGQLLRGAKMIELMGTSCEVSAEINSLQTMSAHGDANDLLNFISCQDPATVKQLYLVHGELKTQEAFAEKLKRRGFEHVTIPAMHETIEVK